MLDRKGRTAIKLLCVLVMSFMFVGNVGSVPRERGDLVDAANNEDSFLLEDEMQTFQWITNGRWRVDDLDYEYGIHVKQVQYEGTNSVWKDVASSMMFPYIDMFESSLSCQNTKAEED